MKRVPAFVAAAAALLLAGVAFLYTAGRRDAAARQRRQTESDERRLADLQGRALFAKLRRRAILATGRPATRPDGPAAPLTATEEAELAELRARALEREIDRLAARHPLPRDR